MLGMLKIRNDVSTGWWGMNKVVMFGLLAAVLSGGCGFSSEQRELEERLGTLNAVAGECETVREVVSRANGFMSAFERSIQDFSANASQVRTLDDIKISAQQYATAVDGVVNDLGTLGGDLESLDVSSSQLVGYKDEYGMLIEGFRSALANASEAMSIVETIQNETDLSPKIEQSQQATLEALEGIQELSNRESEVIESLNFFCNGVAEEKVQAELELIGQ